MSQSTTLSPALTAAQLAAMNGEQIVKMGRELIAQLGSDPDSFHGNIWPGNIHFDEDGRAVLGDGSDAPVSARTPEQIEYMAPEAFWENDFSRSADLYSIALLMYTAYNGGRLPFTSSLTPSDADRAQALRTRMKGGELPVPESAGQELGAILRRELSYSRGERYLTADSMMHELSETDEALPSAAPDDESPSDLQAAAAAAATGLAGVSAVAEMSAIPREVVRPYEAAAGVSASSILMEQELHAMEEKPAGEDPAGAGEPAPLSEIFSAPAAKPEPETAPEAEAAPEAADPVPEAEAAPEAADPAPEAEAAPEAADPVPEAEAAPEDAAAKAPVPEPEAKSDTDTAAEAAPAPAAEDAAERPKAAEAADKPDEKASASAPKAGGKPRKKGKKPAAKTPASGIIDLSAEAKPAPEAVVSETDAERPAAEKPAAAKEPAEAKPVQTKKTPETKPAQAAKTAKPTQTKNTSEAKPAARKQHTVQKSVDPREETRARRKNRSGTFIALGVGALVIAGLICVAAYSLGAFEKEPAPLISSTIPPQTAEPTAEPTPAPTVPVYTFTAVAADLDWDELDGAGLAVLDGQDSFDAAVAAAEKAGLENLWLGARYLDGADAPDGKPGWYWLDGTQLPENSSFWAENEPSSASGGRLMLRRSAADGRWRFHAVTREQFESAGTGVFAKLGYLTDGSGMAVRPTPSPSPSAKPTLTPAPTEAPGSRGNGYVYVPSTAAPTAAPTSAPTAAPTTAPTAAPTTAPDPYTAKPGTASWTELTAGGTALATAPTAEKFAAVTAFLDRYNTAHSDKPLYNVWLGAQYLEADEDSGREAGWYWTDGTTLAADNENWAEGESAGTTGCKLMLRSVGGSWKYYAVTDAQFSAELTTTYSHSGALAAGTGA